MLFYLWPVTDISATVAPMALIFCMMVHIGPGQISLLWAVLLAVPKSEILGLIFGHLTTQRYMSIRAEHQLDKGFLKL